MNELISIIIPVYNVAQYLETIFKETKPVWHNKPFVYKLKVTDGQVVKIYTEWQII